LVRACGWRGRNAEGGEGEVVKAGEMDGVELREMNYTDRMIGVTALHFIGSEVGNYS